MSESAVRTHTASLACLLLTIFVAGCIADTTHDPAATDTDLESDTWEQPDTDSSGDDSGNDPDEDGIPSASDICPDTYDPRQNDWDKDGAGDACDPTIDLNESNALVMRNLPVQEWARIQLSSIGDFDGDGYEDFAVGVPAMNEERGRIFLYSGTTLERRDGQLSPSEAAGALSGESEDDLVGCKLQGVGDVNGDGLDDFTTLQCQRINRQGAHLILGRNSLALSEKVETLSEMKFAIARRSKLPYADILPLGDVNRDGKDDFALGAWAWPRVVRVIPGASTFPEDVGQGDHHFLDEWKTASSTIELPDPSNDSLIQFAPLGDINGDEITDFGIVDHLATNGPSVEAHLLSASSFPTTVGDAVPIESLSESSDFPGGTASNTPIFIPLRDVNGDGLTDFAFSSPSSGGTKIFFGSTSRLDASTLENHDAEILHPSNVQIIAGTDVNSDGFADLIFTQGSNLRLLNGNRNWNENVSVPNQDDYDLVISVGTDHDFRSPRIVGISANREGSSSRIALLLEGEDHNTDSGMIFLVNTDLPLASN